MMCVSSHPWRPISQKAGGQPTWPETSAPWPTMTLSWLGVCGYQRIGSNCAINLPNLWMSCITGVGWGFSVLKEKLMLHFFAIQNGNVWQRCPALVVPPPPQLKRSKIHDNVLQQRNNRVMTRHSSCYLRTYLSFCTLYAGPFPSRYKFAGWGQGFRPREGPVHRFQCSSRFPFLQLLWWLFQWPIQLQPFQYAKCGFPLPKHHIPTPDHPLEHPAVMTSHNLGFPDVRTNILRF